MDNNSFSEADFPGKRCVFSESSPLRVLSALSRCPHAGICGVCVQRSWGIAASSHTPLSSTLSLLVPPVCVGRGGESSTWDCFPGSCAVLALDAFVDQSRRTGFHLDPADPCARRFREVERAGSREFSWEPAKADHQRCLVFAGSRIAERLNDSKRMFHLKEVCFPACLCISNPSLRRGPGLVSTGAKCSVFDGLQAGIAWAVLCQPCALSPKPPASPWCRAHGAFLPQPPLPSCPAVMSCQDGEDGRGTPGPDEMIQQQFHFISNLTLNFNSLKDKKPRDIRCNEIKQSFSDSKFDHKWALRLLL